MKPLLKWPGSKRRVASELAAHIRPHLTDKGRYIELFAGSAAVFFELEPKRAVLVDICKPLMAFYEAVARSADVVADELDRLLALPHGEETYNQIKREWNSNDFGAAFAAKLLYLNRLGFNGLFRLNQKGGFNVAWGKSEKMPGFPSRGELREAGELLQCAKLYAKDYAPALRTTHKGDAIYADPPYWGTYDRYAGGRFKEEDQHKLAGALAHAVQRGAAIFTSNLDCKEIRGLYESWAKIDVIPVLHKISCTADGRKTVNEALISAKGPFVDLRQLDLFNNFQEPAEALSEEAAGGGPGDIS